MWKNLLGYNRRNWPQWLRDAETKDAKVTVKGFPPRHVVWHSGEWLSGDWYGDVWESGVWHSGAWHDGAWYNGRWHDGVWNKGIWHKGTWRNGQWVRGIWVQGVWDNGLWLDGDWGNGTWRQGRWQNGIWRRGNWLHGVWHNGEWHNGMWSDGTWQNGTWYGGTWCGGEWEGGKWHDLVIKDRVWYMAHVAGIATTKNGDLIGYRTTQGVHTDYAGRYAADFHQPQGKYYEKDARPAGDGVCVRGIHVTGLGRAHTYFNQVDPTAQLWRVVFKREDLLDCDGEKARIRGGYFEPVNTPWMAKAQSKTIRVTIPKKIKIGNQDAG